MTLDEIISTRASVRKYADKEVDKNLIEQIVNAAHLAPSACNKQPWRFVIASNRQALEIVNKDGLGGVFVSNKWAQTAPVIIVVCSQKELIVHSIAEKVQGVDYHLIDLGIACQQLVLKAWELGLGTCYIGWFNGKAIKKGLELPRGFNVECLITLGWPAPDLEIKPQAKKPVSEICIWK